jgi:3'-phosphoadenosine 5'-phosphosulfate sulfotransferase (PAPS reductase)/FAD synthetase
VIAKARDLYAPIATWCLFSGGNDSTVLAHRCRDAYDGLAFIDTGTAADGVVDFVHEFAAWIGKPLRVMSAGDAYERMVLGGNVLTRGAHAGEVEDGHGFPGKGQHGKAYTRLKERQIEALLKETKIGKPRNARVLFLSGIRRAESLRRAKRQSITKKRAAVFANPLIDWTNDDMRAYRREHAIPESDAAALLHRSGECNCGAFADAESERAMLKGCAPVLMARIEALEARAEAQGVKWCRWGGYDLAGNQAAGDADEGGELCSSCAFREPSLFDLGAVA